MYTSHPISGQIPSQPRRRSLSFRPLDFTQGTTMHGTLTADADMTARIL